VVDSLQNYAIIYTFNAIDTAEFRGRSVTFFVRFFTLDYFKDDVR